MDKNLWFEEFDGFTLIGVTENLQDDAGDIAFASIAEVGDIDADDTLLNIEASKATIEIPSPYKGKVIEKNEAAEADPSLLNSLDKAKNWIVKIHK